MKTYLKGDRAQVGLVTKVYVTESGQKRLTVRFPHSTVDADIADFEVV